MSETKPIVIFPFPARENEYFIQSCNTCGEPLKKGFFMIGIKVKYPEYKANLFLGEILRCPICGQLNTILKIIEDEDETNAEMYMLAEDIRENNGIIRATTISDIF